MTQLPADLLENHWSEYTDDEIMEKVEKFCLKHGLMDQVETFKRGAMLAVDPNNLDRIPAISPEERQRIQDETCHRWRQPFMIYYITVLSSMSAITQSMDQAVVEATKDSYYDRFGIASDGSNKTALIQGLVNSAPYLCCVLVSSWITDPLNRFFGRRGSLFCACLVSFMASIWQAFTYSWNQLFVARLLLGLGIGPQSATAPIYTAECAPSPIRGALVMQWQMWTAFGIILGDVVSVIFVDMRADISWRLTLGSTFIGPMIVCCMIYNAPESPGWYITKGKMVDAYESMRKLRFSDLQASRDFLNMVHFFEIQRQNIIKLGSRNLIFDLVKVPRVRRAAQASGLLMFMQQFSGFDLISYYSDELFVSYGFGDKQAILAKMGTDIGTWLFAIPAIYTIDTFGRRKLLLITLPAMAICLLVAGFGFSIPIDGPSDNRQIGVITTAIYLYIIFYSPGAGPVPFTYSAEAFPLYIRDLGMSYATAVYWFFKLSYLNYSPRESFVLTLTFPQMLTAFQPQGAFSWYAGWCIICWVLIFFTLPETKVLTLAEELDYVFLVPTTKHATYQMRNLIYMFRKHVLRQDVTAPPDDPLSNQVSSPE